MWKQSLRFEVAVCRAEVLVGYVGQTCRLLGAFPELEMTETDNQATFNYYSPV